MKEIIFILKDGTANIDQIGGTDSYLRRLIKVIGKKKVELVYKSNTNEIIEIDNICIQRFDKILKIYGYLKKKPSAIKIISNLNFFEKIILLPLKKRYLLNFFYPKNLLIHLFKYIEINFFGYISIIVPSLRLKKIFNKWHKSIIWLPPIIPDKYKPDNTLKRNKFSFIGRADLRKGLKNFLYFKKKFPKYNWYISLIKIDKDYNNTEIEYLLKTEKINWRDRSKFNYNIEKALIKDLQTTKVFFQPYETLDSTVDLPLLILEAQACGCVVISNNIDKRYLCYTSRKLNQKFNLQKFLENLPSNKNIIKCSKKIRNLYSSSHVREEFFKIVK